MRPSLTSICCGLIATIGFAQEPTGGVNWEDLSNPDAEFRRKVCEKLAAIRPKPTEVIQALAKLLADSDFQVRKIAISGLSSQPNSAIEVVEALIAATKDSEGQIRAGAAGLLGISRSPSAYPVLLALLADPDEQVRAISAGRLEGFRKEKSEEIVAALIPLLGDKAPRVRGAVASVLGRLGPAAKEALVHARGGCEAHGLALVATRLGGSGRRARRRRRRSRESR